MKITRKITTIVLAVMCQTAMFAHTELDVQTDTTSVEIDEVCTESEEVEASADAPKQFSLNNWSYQSSPSLMAANPPSDLYTKLEKPTTYEKYGSFTPLREFSVQTVPLVAFGFIAKANKKNFRAARNNFIPSYKNGIDDYAQLAPLALTGVLNVCGYEGRSRIDRWAASSAMSYIFMAGFVNAIKYSAKEMRPDGSTANSFPSGHTATAFTAATILHKEYGLTRSPWWSVGGYGCAIMTGTMRSLNNRHWISDILVGAGIGVLSADLGYMVVDYIYKNKGLKRRNRVGNADLLTQRSFFNLSLGMQINSDIKLPTDVRYTTQAQLWSENNAPMMDDDYFEIVRQGNPFNISDYNTNLSDKQTYTHYANPAGRDQEGFDAFWNKPTIKVGIGTSVSAEAAYFPLKNFGFGARLRVTTSPVYVDGLTAYDMDAAGNVTPLKNSASASDVWSIMDWGLGFHFALPFNSQHRISAKALYGCRYFGKLDMSGANDIDLAPYGHEGNITLWGDNLYVGKSSANSIGGGLQYTFAMTNGVAISTFCDFDYCKPEFDVEYQPYNTNVKNMVTTRSTFSFKQKVMSFSFGASMTVLF